jgi:hypothetical protein
VQSGSFQVQEPGGVWEYVHYCTCSAWTTKQGTCGVGLPRNVQIIRVGVNLGTEASASAHVIGALVLRRQTDEAAPAPWRPAWSC